MGNRQTKKLCAHGRTAREGRDMLLKNALIGLAGLAASMTVSASTVVNAGSYSLEYDETTVFGDPTLSVGPGNSVGFAWSIPASVAVVSLGPTAASAPFLMPTYVITTNPGFALNGPITGFIGNLVFTDILGITTTATVSGALNINGAGDMPFSEALTKTVTLPIGLIGSSGFMSLSPSVAIGAFSSFAFSGGLLLEASGGDGFAQVLAQPQNVFRVSFEAAPVPLPAAVWLFSSALIGLAVRRRSA